MCCCRPVTSSKMAANMGDHDLFGFRFTEIYNFFSVRFLKNRISFFHSSNLRGSFPKCVPLDFGLEKTLPYIFIINTDYPS